MQLHIILYYIVNALYWKRFEQNIAESKKTHIV